MVSWDLSVLNPPYVSTLPNDKLKYEIDQNAGLWGEHMDYMN